MERYIFVVIAPVKYPTIKVFDITLLHVFLGISMEIFDLVFTIYGEKF